MGFDQEQGVQSYWPGCKATFIVRFEEFGEDLGSEPPELPPQLRKGTTSTAKKLTIESVDGRLELTNAEVAPGGPQKQAASADGFTKPIAGVIPKRATLQRNGIREPDTLDLEFKWVDLPIDPAVVRSCAIELFLGCFTEEQFLEGVRGVGTQQDGGGAAIPLNVIPDNFIAPDGQERSNLRFQGWVDEWEVELADGAEPIVRMRCTDNTRLLAENDAPPQLHFNATLPIDQGFAEYLANFPQFLGLVVEYRPRELDPPVPGDKMPPTAKAKKEGAGPAAGAGQGKLSVWDFLTDIARAVGHNVRMEGRIIVIERARTLFSGQFVRSTDPFKGRVLPSGRELLRRTFIYGRNVSEVNFRRKYAKHGSTNIEVRCYSGRLKKTLIARHPQKDERQDRPLPGNANDQKWLIVPVFGVDDEATLRAIAQDYYESLGRNELEVTFVTRNLASFGGDNSDPDCLDVVAGDPVDVLINRDEPPGASTVTETEDSRAVRAVRMLVDLGFDEEFAEGYALALANQGFPQTYFVRAMVVDWDAGEEGGESGGVTLRFELVNYIEIRSDAKLPAGEEPTAEEVADGTTGTSPMVVGGDSGKSEIGVETADKIQELLDDFVENG
jgi:hypothetical protein